MLKHDQGYGYAKLPHEPATPQTRWFTGSTTKAFTAAAMAQLIHDSVDHPNLTWSTPLSKIIPDEFVLQDVYSTLHITLEDALSHRSGLPRHDLMYGRGGETAQSIVRRMRYLPPTAQPRTEFQYCNFMYTAVSRCLESLTGESMERLLAKNLWAPLGMQSTSFSLASKQTAGSNDPRLARGYFWDSKTQRYVPEPYVDWQPISGAGAMISTVEDYALWITSLLSAATGRQNASSPISPAVYRDLIKPRTILPLTRELVESGLTLPALYSLGWFTLPIPNATIVSHDGAVTGFGAQVRLIPDRNFGIVSMANTMGTGNVVESIISSYLIIRMLRGDEIQNVPADGTAKTILQAKQQAQLFLQMQQACGSEMHPSREEDSDGSRSEYSSAPSQPFPGGKDALDAIVGVYYHPAYGTFSLTDAVFEGSAVEGNLHFDAFLNPRGIAVKLELTHISYTLFRLNVYMLHGYKRESDDGGLEDAVLEKFPGKRLASVELSMDGQAVARLGLQLDDAMISATASQVKKTSTTWRSSMIWFNKVE